MKNKRLLLFLVIPFCILGCTTTQKDTTVGALGGAALGGIIGHQSGHGGTGAAIGGAAGAIGGMLVGEHRSKKFCPICGQSFTESATYCPDCGAELKYKKR